MSYEKTFIGGSMEEKIFVSCKNVKMGDVASVSLVPVADCPPNAPCARQCYARRLAARRGSVLKSWGRNSRILRTDADSFFRQLGGWLTWQSPKFFRWHVGGDFISAEHLKRAIDIAKDFPSTRFLAFTKRYDLLAKTKKTPNNFTLMLSAWQGFNFDPSLSKRYPVAWCRDSKNLDRRIPSKSFTCGGGCDTCKVCFMAKDADLKSVVFDIH